MTTRARIRHAALASALLLGAAPLCFAEPPLDIARLVEVADLVVVGRIVSLVEAAPRADPYARTLQGAIDVVAVVKGPNIAIANFTAAEGLDATPADDCRLFFLKKGPGDFTFVNQFQRAGVVAACGLEFADSQDALSRATEAIGRAAASVRLSPDLRVTAISELESANPRVAAPYLRRLVRDPDREVQVAAAAALLKSGDTAPLPLAEALLLQHEIDLSPGSHAAKLLAAISSGELRGKAAVPSLARLLSSPSTEVRRAVTEALGHTGAAEAIPALTHALDDHDEGVRYNAVQAFASVAGTPEWVVSRERFREDPDRYLSHWRNWAATTMR